VRSGGALDAVMGILDPFPRDRGDGSAQDSLGIRARERAERLFSIDINMRKTEALFSQILQK